MEDNSKDIPVIHNVTTPVELFDLYRPDADELIEIARNFYTKPLVWVLDRHSRKWAEKTKPLYHEEISEIAGKMDVSGAHFLNLSYEWGCTTGAQDDPSGEGVRLLRALDWPVKGMGDKIMLVKQAGPAGEFYNMTYPGFVGVLNGVAKGRFAAAINIAPVPVYTNLFAVDWVVEKFKKFNSHANPAPFLLRKVFEECATFDEAVEMLSNEPLNTPALFTLAGVEKGEHAVIERLYDQSFVHTENACISNVWINDQWKGQGRHNDPPERLRHMRETHKTAQGGFDWLQAPVKNKETVLVFEANAKTGDLTMFGAESGEPSTRVLKTTL